MEPHADSAAHCLEIEQRTLSRIRPVLTMQFASFPVSRSCQLKRKKVRYWSLRFGEITLVARQPFEAMTLSNTFWKATERQGRAARTAASKNDDGRVLRRMASLLIIVIPCGSIMMVTALAHHLTSEGMDNND